MIKPTVRYVITAALVLMLIFIPVLTVVADENGEYLGEDYHSVEETIISGETGTPEEEPATPEEPYMPENLGEPDAAPTQDEPAPPEEPTPPYEPENQADPAPPTGGYLPIDGDETLETGVLILWFNVADPIVLISGHRLETVGNQADIELPFGPHEILVQSRGYQPYTRTIVFENNFQSEGFVLRPHGYASDRGSRISSSIAEIVEIIIVAVTAIVVILGFFLLARFTGKRRSKQYTSYGKASAMSGSHHRAEKVPDKPYYIDIAKDKSHHTADGEINDSETDDDETGNDKIIIATDLGPRSFPNNLTYNFSITRGDMVYIVGPSGSGKSVLLKMLTGYDMKTSGALTMLGGLSWKQADLKTENLLKHKIGYVPQDDALYDDLTPSQLLKYYANLFPQSIWQPDVILHQLGLDECKDKKIEVLSGGQRKRLSIGVELTRNPDILVLDEPDSGLDQENCNKLFSILRHINAAGITIILTTHPPKIPATWRRLPGISMPGNMSMYHEIEGSYEEETAVAPSKPHFRNMALKERSNTGRHTVYNLFLREISINRSNALVRYVAFLTLCCTGFLLFSASVGTFDTYNDALPITFALACASILIGLTTSINMICDYYDVIRREMRMSISAEKMIMAKILFLIITCAIMSVILTAPFLFNRFSIDYQHRLYIYLAVFLPMIASAAVGLVCSCVSRDRPQRAALYIPPIMMFQIFFAGFVFEETPLRMLTISNFAIRVLGHGLRFDRDYIVLDVPTAIWDSPMPELVTFTRIGMLIIFFIVATAISISRLSHIDKHGDKKLDNRDVAK